MSLKWFHVVFISLSIVTAAGFGVWGLFNQYAALGGLSLAVAPALMVYGSYFLRKSRRIGLA
jgi:hypothetical protein